MTLNSNYSNTQNTNRISDSVPNQNINLESEDQSSSNERQHEYSLPVDAEPEELIPFLASQVELKRDDASTATPVKATTENNINSTTSDGITNELADLNINNQV